MNNEDKFIQIIKKKFQEYKGKASTYCTYNKVIPKLICEFIKSFTNKNPNSEITIIIDNYERRKTIIAYFNKNDIIKEKGYKYKIFSKDYVNPKYYHKYDFIITVGVNDDSTFITKLEEQAKFMFVILTNNIHNNIFITTVRRKLPDINTGNLIELINNDNIYSPVEEHRCPIKLSDIDKAKYDKFTNYISDCMSIFNNPSVIEKCKYGDKENNISAMEYRTALAKENGWSENLDVSIEYIKKIDDVFNPNILLERANLFYNITKERRDFVTDNESKLEKIKELCELNSDKQIIIVSKRGEFAARITKYLKENNIKCGDYHDCIDDATAIDANGNIILIKSGINKGKPRIVGSQYQSTANEAAFNEHNINVLSIKSASNNKLKTACNLIIFTSSLCDDIIEFKQRFRHINFDNITYVYKLYCSGTIEQDKINNTKYNMIIKVINEDEKNIEYDENSNSIIW